MKILSDPATGVVLGGSIVGRNAAELISVLAVAVTNGLRVGDIVDSLLVHPSLAELLADAATLLTTLLFPARMRRLVEPRSMAAVARDQPAALQPAHCGWVV